MADHLIPELGLKFRELDLSKGEGHHHPDIKPHPAKYLALVGGQWQLGSFSMVWFGWTMHVSWGTRQFDAPGSNYSTWERLIEVGLPPTMLLQNYIGDDLSKMKAEVLREKRRAEGYDDEDES